MYNVEEIGLRLSELREEKNMTQSELAFELGISRESITRYETGKRSINSDVLNAYAKFFDVSADYIMYGVGKKMKMHGEYQDLMNMLVKVPDNKKEIVYGMIKGMLKNVLI